MTLNLNGKNLTTIPNFSDPDVLKSYGFDKPEDITRLSFHGNNISKIENLNLLINLKELNLSKNKISKIDPAQRGQTGILRSREV